jgi:hypothetical protein
MAETDQIEIPEINSPQRGSKDGYLQLFFLARQQLGRIIEQTSGLTDQRILMYTKHMISSITDDELREKAWDDLYENMKRIEEEGGTPEQKSAKIFDYCMELQGDITAFYDQFLGITHRLKAGTV